MQSVWLEAPRPGTLARARIRSSQDVREIERTPFQQLMPNWSILEVLQEAAVAAPARPSIITAATDPTRVGRTLTRAEVAEAVRATAARIRSVSGTAVPVISILTPLVAEAFIALWAGATVGRANPINPFLRIDHVAEIMNAAGTTVLLCAGPAHGPGAWNQVAELRARVPTLRAIWSLDEGGAGELFARELDRERQAPAGALPAPDPDRTATLLHTGGTTSAPKLVRLTQRGQLLNAWCCGAFTGCQADTVMALGMPYFHVGGAVCLSLAAMLFGQTVVIVSPAGYRDPRVIGAFWDIVAAHGISQVGSTPTTPAALLAAPARVRAPPGFIYWAGGAAVPVQVARDFADRFGVPLCEGWGMTEMQGGMILNPTASEPRLGSTGIPFPYHQARCVKIDAESADELATPGQTGVLAISGPCVTAGYLDERRTPELFLKSGAAGTPWLNTGDLCTIDGDGYVWLKGRSKDLIIRGGHNIDPQVIENALLAHPAVMLAAAIGQPHRDKGEVPLAYVQLRPGASAQETELLAHCQATISERAAMPREVRVLEAMPMTAVGKIFKPALRVDAVRRCVASVQASLGAGEVPLEVTESGGSIAVKIRAQQMSPVVRQLVEELGRYTFSVTTGPLA